MEKINDFDLEQVNGGTQEANLDHPIIRSDLCTKCHVCAEYCTEGAISFNGSVYKIITEKCTRCGTCALVCPVKAIKGTKQS